ncbi:MAG: transposase [Burkholderiaceae bacterium]
MQYGAPASARGLRGLHRDRWLCRLQRAGAATSGIEQQGCWAHCRRGFVDAIKAAPGASIRAEQAIEFIKQLYRIERDLAGQTDAERFLARRLRSVPILKQLRGWLDETITAVTPKSTLGKALAYSHSMWPTLIRYVEWGYLPIDNNPAENAIRPFVVGRKAWMFNDTARGAQASAMIYSLVETAKSQQDRTLRLAADPVRAPACGRYR